MKQDILKNVHASLFYATNAYWGQGSKKGKSIENVNQNVSFCDQQRKESHMGLEQQYGK